MCLLNNKMHDLMTDFETVTPDSWMVNEEGWKEKLLKLPNWSQVIIIAKIEHFELYFLFDL